MKPDFLFSKPKVGEAATPVTKITSSGSLPRLANWLELAFGALLLWTPCPARAAGVFYYDLAGGISKYMQTSPFFGATAQGSTSYGYALNNAVFVNLGGSQQAFAFQFGLQHRLSAASDTVGTYAVQTAYPVLRLQLSRIFIAAGYTPFVWRRVSDQGGLDYFSRAQQATATLLETGLILPVTPKFSMAIQGGAQFISDGGTRSPSPIWDGTFSMRFYFGFYGNGGDHSSSEFKGWRYPFGAIR